MTLEEFEKMVRNHDLTYSYSDDGNVYRRGSEERQRIIEAAKEFPEEAKEIWNKVVDQKLAEGFRDTFYWR